MDAPFALAFAAGLVASVNPCGFAMLPAYLSFLLGTGDADQSRAAAVARALRVGMTVSAGFLVVFGLAGVALTAGARWLTTAIPFAALAVGVVLAVVGVFMLTGRSIPVRLPTVTRAGTGTGTGNRATALFGVSYAVASLSCTLPVFLVVVGSAGTQTSLAAGVATFATYATGMALPLLAVAVALALGKDAAVKRIRGMARYTTQAAGGLLVLAGGYIVFYWATVLVPGERGPASAGGGLTTGMETLSSQLTSVIGARPLLSAGLLLGVIGVAVGYVWRSRRQGTDTDTDTEQSPQVQVSQTRPRDT